MLPAQIIRLECLRLALSVPHAERGDAITLAGNYANFVHGTDKAGATPVPGAATQGQTVEQGHVRRR